jgi:hypothetical protein
MVCWVFEPDIWKEALEKEGGPKVPVALLENP